MEPSFAGILQILGKSGSGKSVIFKSILDRIRKASKNRASKSTLCSGQYIFYFAFNAHDRERCTATNLLGSLIVQLLAAHGAVPLSLLDETRGRLDSRPQNPLFLWSFNDVLRIFSDLVTSGYPDFLWEGKLIFVLDAIDECTAGE